MFVQFFCPKTHTNPKKYDTLSMRICYVNLPFCFLRFRRRKVRGFQQPVVFVLLLSGVLAGVLSDTVAAGRRAQCRAAGGGAVCFISSGWTVSGRILRCWPHRCWSTTGWVWPSCATSRARSCGSSSASATISCGCSYLNISTSCSPASTVRSGSCPAARRRSRCCAGRCRSASASTRSRRWAIS